MKVPPPRRRIDVEEALRLRKQEGLSGIQIATRLGFTARAVRNAIRRAGISLRPTRTISTAPDGQRLYNLWRSLHTRCSRPRDLLYARYGARGYSVGNAWKTFWPFYDWAVSAGYRPSLTLDVVGKSRRFSPATCRWITRRQRMERYGFPSGKKPFRMITAFGETKSAPEWARDARCTVTVGLLRRRISRGVPPEQALTLVPDARQRLPKERQAQRRARRRRLLDWKEIVRLYAEEHLTVVEIAERFRANPGGLRVGLKKSGVWKRRPALGIRTLRKIFDTMHRRCSNKNDASYVYYGARGARVCKEWRSFEAFSNWALGNGYRPGLGLTRRSGVRLYSPANCRWATRAETARAAQHTEAPRRPVWTVKAFGEIKGPTDWSRDPRCEVTLPTLLRRLRGGWHPEEAISAPPQGPGQGHAPSVLVTAFHQTKGVTAWSRDRRCKVALPTLAYRLNHGVPPEEAIAARPFRLGKPGRDPDARKWGRRRKGRSHRPESSAAPL